jgi:hypothetical protein
MGRVGLRVVSSQGEAEMGCRVFLYIYGGGGGGCGVLIAIFAVVIRAVHICT